MKNPVSLRGRAGVAVTYSSVPRILGACNPPLVHRASEAEPDISLRLPCNVLVHEEPDGPRVVGFMIKVAVLQMTSSAEVAKVAHEVRERLQRVKALLVAPATTPNQG